MTQPRKIALAQHADYPNVAIITGLPFVVAILVAGREITPEEGAIRMAEMEKLVRGYNLLDEVV